MSRKTRIGKIRNCIVKVKDDGNLECLAPTIVSLQHSTRVKADAIVEPHERWLAGEWVDDGGYHTYVTPSPGETWRVDLMIVAGGKALIAMPLELLKEAV